MARVSIFDLERRTDIYKEYREIYVYIQNTIFILVENSYTQRLTLFGIIDKYFNLWPHRISALNMHSYFNKIGIDLNIPFQNDSSILYFFEFIYNYIYWFRDYISKNKTIYFHNEKKAMEKILTIIQNMNHILDLMNYKINDIEGKLIIVKRNEDVDSVLPIVPEISHLLLSYNDFRIKDNIIEKKLILKQLGDYLELDRKEKYEKINKSLTDDIFFLLNKVNIRHANANQINLNNQEQMECYDNLFKLIIHLIRQEEINEIQEEYVKKLKNIT